MEKSLINPNKCWKFGVQICDDPNNSHRKPGIESSEDLFILTKMEGSTCGTVTNTSTDNDIHECQNSLLSDEFGWCPSKNLFEMSSMEEEYRKSSNFNRYVNIVVSRVPLDFQTMKCRYDLEVHESNRAMENVSIGLA